MISSTKTDRQLFDDLKVDDIWPKADLVQVWCYLYKNTRLAIPPFWEDTLANFNQFMDSVWAHHLQQVFSPMIPNTKDLWLFHVATRSWLMIFTEKS